MMSFQHLVKNCEMKFWDVVTPVMGNKGPIMKTKSFLFKLLHNKHKYLILLVAVCGSVGFLAGILIGKLIQIFPPV
jgi:hypothetical protein